MTTQPGNFYAQPVTEVTSYAAPPASVYDEVAARLAQPDAAAQVAAAQAAPPQLTAADMLRPETVISLKDGSTAELVYSFAGLWELEKTFGSVAGIQAALDMDPTKPVFGPLAQLIYCGLAEMPQRPPFERFLTRLDPAELVGYMQAVQAAVTKAFGPLAALAASMAQTPPETASPGPSGTTSQPSSSDGMTAPGGA